MRLLTEESLEPIDATRDAARASRARGAGQGPDRADGARDSRVVPRGGPFHIDRRRAGQGSTPRRHFSLPIRRARPRTSPPLPSPAIGVGGGGGGGVVVDAAVARSGGRIGEQERKVLWKSSGRVSQGLCLCAPVEASTGDLDVQEAGGARVCAGERRAPTRRGSRPMIGPRQIKAARFIAFVERTTHPKCWQ